MYARLISFKMGPGTRQTADAMRGQFAQALRASPDLDRVYFLADYETGKYTTVAIWKSKDAGEAAFEAIFPRLQEAVNGLAEEPPTQQFLEVAEVVMPENV